MFNLSIGSGKCAFTSSNNLATNPDSTKHTIKRFSENLNGEVLLKVTGNGIPKNVLSTNIRPPPLTAKEIYRLKTTWSTSFENYVNVKEAGVETIMR